MSFYFLQSYTFFQIIQAKMLIVLFYRTVARLPLTGRRLGAGGGTLSVIRTTNGQFPTKGY